MVVKRWKLGFIVFLLMLSNVSVLRAIESVSVPVCQEEVTAFMSLPSEHTLAVMSGTNEALVFLVVLSLQKERPLQCLEYSQFPLSFRSESSAAVTT